MERHLACAELCLDYALGQCSAEHMHRSSNVDDFHKLRKEIKDALNEINGAAKKASFITSWEQIDSNHNEYLAHIVRIVRTRHQGD